MTNELRSLFSELKQYLCLEERFVLLSVAEKGTVILSMLIIIGVLLVLASMMVAFLLMGLAFYLGRELQNVALGYCCVAGIAVLLALVFYSLRTTIVINPLARLMKSLLTETTKEVES